MNALERLPKGQAAALAVAIKTRASIADSAGSRLYAELGRRIPDDSELLEIATHGLAALPELHLFIAVNYLLMREPHDPLAQYYRSFTENPRPPNEAFADFARYCKKHRDEILHLLKTRTIQMTAVERCKTVMPLLSYVAKLAGEPLSLIEELLGAGNRLLDGLQRGIWQAC